MSFALYIIGFMILIGGVGLGAYYMHVPAHWIAVAVLIVAKRITRLDATAEGHAM